MTDTLDQQANERDWQEWLAHPNPPVDDLPAIPEKADSLLQMETAGHLVRAILRQEESVSTLEAQARQDAQAWANVITKAQARADAWRAIVLDWMQRNEVKQIKTPWFTGYIKKGTPKIVVDDEAACIAHLKTLKADKAWRSVESIVKKEFDAIFNARPKDFAAVPPVLPDGDPGRPSLAHEDKGEPSLVIKRAKE